jgi:hypothetical protein
VPPYAYETNPHYSFGYAEFFGPYYTPYGNNNNVISLSLFSDSLKINNIGSLEGFGQYLFLEDIFLNPTDTLLQTGTYTISDTGLPFTVAPGKNDTVDNNVFTIGATISYYEQNAAKSTLKLIKSGTFTLSVNYPNYIISCNFKTDDKKNLQGRFSAQLPYVDESINMTISNGSRRKLLHLTELKNSN